MTHDLADGGTVEQALIGHEGFLGTALIMGGTAMPSRKVVQIGGCAYRLPGKVLKAEFERQGELRDVLLRFVQCLFVQVAQTAVCNRHHSVEQQLCRWLLLALDRMVGVRLAMTQRLIADLLGVRRAGVTLAAGRLQKQKLIACSRGQLRVLDRPGLEQHSCECYEVIRNEYERLLSLPEAYA